MTPQIEREVSREVKQIRPENELTFIMAMEIFAPYHVRLIGSILMAIMLSIILVELKILSY
jgi:hypothetical protein